MQKLSEGFEWIHPTLTQSQTRNNEISSDEPLRVFRFLADCEFTLDSPAGALPPIASS